MTDNSRKNRIVARLEQALTDLKQLAPDVDVEKIIRAGHLLTTEMAADVRGCSGEWIRRLCQKTAATSHPIGIRLGRAWIIVTNHFLDWIESKDGKPERLTAEDNLAKKYRFYFGSAAARLGYDCCCLEREVTSLIQWLKAERAIRGAQSIPAEGGIANESVSSTSRKSPTIAERGSSPHSPDGLRRDHRRL